MQACDVCAESEVSVADLEGGGVLDVCSVDVIGLDDGFSVDGCVDVLDQSSYDCQGPYGG